MRHAGRVRTLFTIAGVVMLAGAPLAFANGEGRPFLLGKRNPGSGGLTKESQVIANIAKGAGGSGTGTGGFSTRQSNLSSSGGGAIYGCRSTTGNEACVAANNLANGDAFRFQAGTNSPEVGVLRFGTSLATLFNKPPFVTNGTATVTNLSADKLDGLDSTSFAPVTVGPYAVVSATGAISHNHFAVGSASVARPNNSTATFTVTFSQDVSACAAQATLSAAGSIFMAASTGGSTATVTETSNGALTPEGFNLSLTCGGS